MRNEQRGQVSFFQACEMLHEKAAQPSYARSGAAGRSENDRASLDKVSALWSCCGLLLPQRPASAVCVSRPPSLGCLFCFDKGRATFCGQNRFRNCEDKQTDGRQIYWDLVGDAHSALKTESQLISFFLSTWDETLVCWIRLDAQNRSHEGGDRDRYPVLQSMRPTDTTERRGGALAMVPLPVLPLLPTKSTFHA